MTIMSKHIKMSIILILIIFSTVLLTHTEKTTSSANVSHKTTKKKHQKENSENPTAATVKYYRESIARKHQNNNNNNNSNLSIDLESKDNSRWIKNAIKDIAYYLRSHKFNEYDRRYNRNETDAEKIYFKTFPEPPLRSLHWEVHANCEPSFLQCIDYLQKKIKLTALRRQDDTSMVILENQWNMNNHSIQIEQIDAECKQAFRRDFRIAPPFQGPLERYQWRTTASYYMCWYTMNEVPDLKHIGENCDNFANCLSEKFGTRNRDPRADDSQPFACAQYSFCPDPCCVNKHLLEMDFCWNNMENPCFNENPASQRKCFFNRSQNTEFSHIILNRWNVSCKCAFNGYKWNSLYGICIDIDECSNSSSNGGNQQCKSTGEACLNLLGKFMCVCKWGYKFDENSKKCIKSSIISNIMLHSGKIEKKVPKNYWKRLVYVTMTIAGRSKAVNNQLSTYSLLLILFVNFLFHYLIIML